MPDARPLPDSALLAINSATVKPWTLEQLVEGCVRAGITGIAPWRDIVQAAGVEKAGSMIRAAGLTVTCLCRGGLFPAADEAGRRAALDDNRRAVDEAAAIGARCLVLIAGGLPKGSKDIAGAQEQVRDGLAALLPYARDCGVPLAIEPLHPMYAADRACVNTLAHANDLCDELGEGSASRSTSITCGGTRTCRGRSRAPARASSPITSATGWCRPRTCCSTAACRATA